MERDIVLIDDKATFADTVINEYLENGLGTMSKREIDILMMNLLMKFGYVLEEDVVEEGDESHGEKIWLQNLGNNDLSILLHVTEARVKSLRYEALLKNPPDENYVQREFLYLLAMSQFEFEKNDLDPYKGKIYFVMEDKYLRQAIQGILKKEGMFADTTFNSEIIKINPAFLIEVIQKLYDSKTAQEFKDGFDQLIQPQEDAPPKICTMQDVVTTFLQKMSEGGGELVGKAIFQAILIRLGIILAGA